MLPQADEKIMRAVLGNEDELNARVFQFPTSAIKLNDRKINYYDFISSMENEDCNKAILRIFPHIDIDCINTFVDNVPYIVDLQKNFYKIYITARYEKILLPVYRKLNR